MIQAKEKSDLTVKIQLTTNLALETKDLFAEQIHHHHPDNVPSKNHSKNTSIVPELSAKVAQLAPDIEHLTHRVQKLDKQKISHRSNTVSTSTTRSGTSGRVSRKSRVSNLAMSSADRCDTIVHDIKQEKRNQSTYKSSSDPYSQSWKISRTGR